jgi:hypothetical protein
MSEPLTWLGVLVLAMTFVNFMILGFNLKLYTEIMKEKSHRDRR